MVATVPMASRRRRRAVGDGDHRRVDEAEIEVAVAVDEVGGPLVVGTRQHGGSSTCLP
jgi:hypothetical protein